MNLTKYIKYLSGENYETILRISVNTTERHLHALNLTWTLLSVQNNVNQCHIFFNKYL